MRKKYSIQELDQLIQKEVRPWKESLRLSLLLNLKEVWSDKRARSIYFLMKYYGLLGPGLTLEEIGQQEKKPLTRERVRQLLEEMIKVLRAKEKETGHRGPNPFEMVKGWYTQQIQLTGATFASLKELMDTPLTLGFEDEKGVCAFLKDADIKQAIYRNQKYLYVSVEKRKGIIQEIQSFNKKERKAKTEKRAQEMAKTVTYVPYEVKQAIVREQERVGEPLNRMYENILSVFAQKSPWKKHPMFFEKTKSWRFRKDKTDWVQIGLYIKRESYDQAKACSKAAGVSLMSYICRAVAWGTSDDPDARNASLGGKRKNSA
jgi:hypothetical protein